MTEKPLPGLIAPERVKRERRLPLRISARRIADGDRGEFERLFRNHHQELYRYCLAIVGSREDAEDALQATMAAALKSLPGEERDIDLRPWLFRVAHNEAISALRKRRPGAELDEQTAATSHSAEEESAQRERLRQLVEDLQQLPDRQRSALVMRELSGLSYGDIGGALSSGEGAARQTVHEARMALSELAEGREMECEGIRQLISEQDRRRLRARRVRAHLRGCDGCTAFAAGIDQRRADLQALCPPLPAVAATAVLGSILGGGGATAGVATGVGVGAVGGGGLAASALVKGRLRDRRGRARDRCGRRQRRGRRPRAGRIVWRPSAPIPGIQAVTAVRAREDLSSDLEGSGPADSPGRPEAGPGRDDSPGRSDEAPGHDGSPGKSEEAPGHDGSPGKSEEAPGQNGSPGNSGERARAQREPGQLRQRAGPERDRGQLRQRAGPEREPGQLRQRAGPERDPGQLRQRTRPERSPGNSGSAPGQNGAPGGSGTPPGNGNPAGGQGTPPGQAIPPAGQGIPLPGQGAGPKGQGGGPERILLR